MRCRGITLDQYIEKLEVLKKLYGGDCEMITDASDYPEGAEGPYYVTRRYENAYRPTGSIVLS